MPVSAAIIDFGMGNLDSIFRAVEECGGNPVITDTARGLSEFSHIILPGVGSFTKGMKNIAKRGIDSGLRGLAADGRKPLLGICLGMQLLATRGFEGGEFEGLNLIPGEVQKLIPENRNERIPHVGWNNVDLARPSPLFDGIRSGTDFYFVHSYHFVCRDGRDILATTPYCRGFTSVIARGNIYGVQFHPEKSQKPGFMLLKNFLKIQ